MPSRRAILLSCLAILFLAVAAPVRAAEPAPTIRAFSDRLVEVMKDGPKLGFKGRADRLGPAVAAAYDMTAMTRTMLGTAAARLAPAEEARVVEAFTRLSVATYARQFKAWDGERIEVGEPRPAPQGAVIVPTRILPRAEEPVAIDYLMRESQGRWGIVDVLYQGTVSQVAVRRSEFLSIFRARGLDGLLAALEAQTAAQAVE